MVVDRRRHADATRFGKTFKPGRDIHTVAMNVARPRR